jgi:hypothetical protein
VQLPPPDPNEAFDPGLPGPIPAAMAVFTHGPPSPAADQIADRLLDHRPGLLIVVTSD